MAIGNAVQRGAWVYVYDERNMQVATIPAGNEPGDGLKGYTGSTVNVQRGAWIYTYDEHGMQTGTVPSR